MIAYRAEIWCDGCSLHFAKGTPHDDVAALPSLAKNLEEIAKASGWTLDGAAHFCPRCQVDKDFSSRLSGATPEQIAQAIEDQKKNAP